MMRLGMRTFRFNLFGWMIAVLLAGAGFGVPGAAWAQASAEGGEAVTTLPVWEASIVHQRQHLSEGRAAWQAYQLMVQRRSARGAMLLQGNRVQRFGVWDEALKAEAWRDLWAKAYGHLRLQYAPTPQILPGQELYAELFQAVPGGWEVAGSYSHRRYPEQTVHSMGLGLGKYVGNWYLRGKTTVIPQHGSASVVQRLRARWYLNAPREYIGVQVGGGRIRAIVDEGPILETVRTYFVTAQLQTYLTSHFGISVVASYSDDAFFIRQGVTLGLLTRW